MGHHMEAIRGGHMGTIMAAIWSHTGRIWSPHWANMRSYGTESIRGPYGGKTEAGTIWGYMGTIWRPYGDHAGQYGGY